MIVTRISKDSISTLSLPQKIKGQFWIYNGNTASEKDKLISIEGINDKWILKSNRIISIVGEKGVSEKSAELIPLRVYALKRGEEYDDNFIFTEPITDDRQTFVKYLAKGDLDLTIGRKEECDICYSSSFVSKDHAVLSLKSGIWYIKDTNSTNGTFVNEKCISEAQLHIGDTVFIMGLKIVIGKNL